MDKRRIVHEREFEDLLDLTPMVNIALILVIVFLCVSPMTLITGIKAVNSGKSSGDSVSLGKSSKDEIVNVCLAKDGSITINGKEIDTRLLVQYLKDAILMSKKKEVMISADPDNTVEEVVHLLDLSKQNGAKKVIVSE